MLLSQIIRLSESPRKKNIGLKNLVAGGIGWVVGEGGGGGSWKCSVQLRVGWKTTCSKISRAKIILRIIHVIYDQMCVVRTVACSRKWDSTVPK